MEELPLLTAGNAAPEIALGFPPAAQPFNRLDAPVIASRLRRFRLARRYTLRQVAEATGTTPQTIHRLESGTMTLSVDWLLRICAALEIDPARLFQSDQQGELRVVATVDAGGAINDLQAGRQEAVTLTGSAQSVFAVRMAACAGAFETGDVLLATPANPYPPANRDWGPCLVSIANETPVLRHVFQTAEGRWITTALDPAGPARFSDTVKWLARILTVIRHIPEIRDAAGTDPCEAPVRPAEPCRP
jgi:transcriptional regulator with XRE-family HTH domain